MPIIPPPVPEGVSYPDLGIARGDYSFAADGGAIGNIVLAGDVIPSGSTILGGFLEIVTPVTSGGAATVAINSEAAGDLVAAAAVSGAPWSTAGRKSIIPIFTGATSVRTTADRQLVATIATAPLTAGAFRVVVFFVPPLI